MKLIIELLLPSANPASPVLHRLVGSPTGWKFTAKQPDGELYYRTTLSGNLTLSGVDFQWLQAQKNTHSCCAEIWLNTYKPTCEPTSSGATDEPFWAGYFTLDDVRWNYTDCTAEVREIKPRDAYDALYRVWETPYNLLDDGIGGRVDRVGFVALYDDYRTWQPDATGLLQHVLPDGNAAGKGYRNREHEYQNALPIVPALTKLITMTTYGTLAGRMAQPVLSDFYALAINPVTKRKNNRKVLMQATDAKRPASIYDADIMNVSLKDMLENLKGLHNVYHCVDPDTGLLRLEHYSWFAEQGYEATRRVTLNLLRFPDALAKANNESTNLESLFGYEELKIANNTGTRYPSMLTGAVKYEGACPVRDDKGALTTNPISVTRFFTDLDAAYRNPDSVPDDAVLVAELVEPHTDPAVQSGLYQLADAYTTDFFGIGFHEANPVGLPLNSSQGASALFVDYHRYGRSYVQGRVNSIKQKDGSFTEGALMYMLSRRPTRRQEGIVIVACCDELPLNLRGYVKTNRFDRAKLTQAVFDLDAETLTIDVAAESSCQGVTVKPADPGSNCPAIGTVLRTFLADNYAMPDGSILYKAQVTEFADGNCGSYQIAFPYIPPITLPPITIPG